MEDAGPEFYDTLVAGFASFFTRADIRVIDERLTSTASCEPEEFEASCTAAVTREGRGPVVRFECAGENLELAAWTRAANSSAAGKFRDGEITRLGIRGRAPLTYLRIGTAKRESAGGDECYTMSPMERSAGLHARLATGERVSEVNLCWKAARYRSDEKFAVTVRATVCNDFASIRQAVAAMVRDGSDSLSSKPLRPGALMTELRGRI